MPRARIGKAIVCTRAVWDTSSQGTTNATTVGRARKATTERQNRPDARGMPLDAATYGRCDAAQLRAGSLHTGTAIG